MQNTIKERINHWSKPLENHWFTTGHRSKPLESALQLVAAPKCGTTLQPPGAALRKSRRPLWPGKQTIYADAGNAIGNAMLTAQATARSKHYGPHHGSHRRRKSQRNSQRHGQCKDQRKGQHNGHSNRRRRGQDVVVPRRQSSTQWSVDRYR